MELDRLNTAWQQLKVESKLGSAISEKQIYTILLDYQPRNKTQRMAVNIFLFLFLAFICQGG